MSRKSTPTSAPPCRLRIKQRSAIVEYAAEGIKPASRRAGLDRKTIHACRDPRRAQGVTGLVPPSGSEKAARA